MKITKEGLLRIIKEEIKNNRTKVVTGTYEPVEYPTSTGKTDPVDDIEELYRSVYATADSVTQMTARIDGIEKAIEKLASQVADNRKMHQVKKATDYAKIDPEDPYIELLEDQINNLQKIVFAMVDELPEDIMADIEAKMGPEEEDDDEE